jgi:hypothetical protein
MRTARSCTSGENFGDFLIMAPFSIEGASSKCGAVQSFATRIQAIECLKSTQRAALAEHDALFASLQHRAFAGQLS